MYKDAMTYSPFAPNAIRRATQGNVTEIQPDMEALHLFNRIKASPASRADRDNLCGMVRWHAADGILDNAAVARILKTLTVLEKNAARRRAQQDYDVPPELTVEQELDAIAAERSQRAAQNQLLERACSIARGFPFIKTDSARTPEPATAPSA
jgi:hypothetical protein